MQKIKQTEGKIPRNGEFVPEPLLQVKNEEDIRACTDRTRNKKNELSKRWRKEHLDTEIESRRKWAKPRVHAELCS